MESIDMTIKDQEFEDSNPSKDIKMDDKGK